MEFNFFLNDESTNPSPETVTVSRPIVDRLTKDLKNTCLEFTLYFFSLYQGEQKQLGGRVFNAVPFDIPKLSRITGYKKTRMYEAINNLIEMGVFTPMEFASRNGSQKYLLVSNEIPPQRNDSAPPESFRHSGKEENTPKSKGDSNLEVPGDKKPPYYTQYNTNNLSDNLNVFDSSSLSSNNNSNKGLNNSIELFDNSSNKQVTNKSLIKYIYKNIEYEIELDRKNHLELRYIDQKIETLKLDEVPKEGDVAKLESLQKARKALLKPFVDKQRSGYRSIEYSTLEGDYELPDEKAQPRYFVSYYMHKVFTKRSVDFYIPKSNIGKYYKRAKTIIKDLGGWKEAKDYIDWFIRQDNHSGLQYSLDALVSTALINSYKNADNRETRKGISKGFVDSVEEAKKRSQKGVIL